MELSQRLAAAKDPTPVVFITAHDGPDVRAQALASGCAAYFHKTDRADRVLEAIRRVAAITEKGKSSPNEALMS